MSKRSASLVRKRLGIVLLALVFLLEGLGIPLNAHAWSDEAVVEVLADEVVAPGIAYREIRVQDGETKNVLHALYADVQRSDVRIITAHAKDKVRYNETLSRQIQREIFKGVHVVGGINGDGFYIGGALYSLGPQVKDGAVVTGYFAPTWMFFGVEEDGRPFISRQVRFWGRMEVRPASEGQATAAREPFGLDVDGVNRDVDAYSNALLVLTNQYNELETVQTSQSDAVLVLVEGAGDRAQLGAALEGRVREVRSGSGTKSLTFTNGQLVLAARGEKATLLASLAPGDAVRLTFGVRDEAAGRERHLREGIAGYFTMLVEDGQVSSMVYETGGHTHPRRPRTGIGLTADGKVIALTVDGDAPSYGISDGMNLEEFAKAMQRLGAVVAVNLDGGGSTTMAARRFGSSEVTVVNRPGDGSERANANSILFVTLAERAPDVGRVVLDPKEVVLYTGSEQRFDVKVADAVGHPLRPDLFRVQWRTEGDVGRVDEAGVFHAGARPGEGEVVARIEGAEGRARVRVVDRVAELRIREQGPIAVENGARKTFHLEAFDDAGRPVVIGNAAAAWRVEGEIGSVDGEGVFTARTDGERRGRVVARVGEREAAVEVVVGRKRMVFEDFEHGDNSRWAVSGFVGGVGEISEEQAKGGSRSMKITYDYSRWTRVYNGTINLVPQGEWRHAEAYTTHIRPKKFALWVYGDGKAPWLRVRLKDGLGQIRTYDLASRIDWTGWKYVDVAIPEDVPLPITFDYIYMVETNKNAPNVRSTVYFDDLQFVYAEDDEECVKPPSVTSFSPSAGTLYTGEVTFEVRIAGACAPVDKESIVFRLDGRDLPFEVVEERGFAVAVRASAAGLAEGRHTVYLSARDTAGNAMNPAYEKVFAVDLSPDVDPPEISQLLPVDGSVVRTPTPRLSARVVQRKSGVDREGIAFILDGVRYAPTSYDEASGIAYLIPPEPLADGEHTLRVSARSRNGLEVPEDRVPEVRFTVQAVPQPRDPRHYTISLWSDTHATGFGPYFAHLINRDESELVIQNGDLVDLDTPAQWAIGDAHAAMIQKPQIFSPGNHEAMNTGSLTNYYRRFGPAIYTLRYGNALLISLNTAFGQSITASDPTQFDYLERVLQGEATADDVEQVILFTHNPTWDTFGTKHEMLYADAVHLEKILGEFKRAHPEKAVTAVFGHLHAAQTWEKDGVRYIINGDGALKRYVWPEWGGILAYTKLHISGNDFDFAFVPLVRRISVVDEALLRGEMKIPAGAERRLRLYGDFSLLTSNYILPLNVPNAVNPFESHVEVRWSSSDPEVAEVDASGTLRAKREGTAEITARVANTSTTFRVRVVDPASVRPLLLRIAPETAEVGGDPLAFQLTAIDAHENAFAVDSRWAEWRLEGDLGAIRDGVLFPERRWEDVRGRVVATFQGKEAAAEVTVKAKPRPARIEVQPSTLELLPGTSQPLHVSLYDEQGNRLPLGEYALFAESFDPQVATVEGGVVTAHRTGKTRVRVGVEGLEGVEAVLPVAVTPFAGMPEVPPVNPVPPVVPPTLPKVPQVNPVPPVVPPTLPKLPGSAAPPFSPLNPLNPALPSTSPQSGSFPSSSPGRNPESNWPFASHPFVWEGSRTSSAEGSPEPIGCIPRSFLRTP
ncbi:MAG: phosphodiester glycosidase family protein [Brockia lithotrophica]|nr:phosphodiester glycosidase family protein [Brockia lithotrophica]